jgi:hypothetical protein
MAGLTCLSPTGGSSERAALKAIAAVLGRRPSAARALSVARGVLKKGLRRAGDGSRPALAILACLTMVLPAGLAGFPATASAQEAGGGQPPPCVGSAVIPPPTVSATSLSTIEQAYWCIFAHYYSGPVLDDRTLLVGAFAGFTDELNRLGTDEADATLPALNGGRTKTKLRGLVLDVRGNGGGSASEVATLLGAFVHNKVYHYVCDVRGKCTAVYPDSSVPLLHLPLVVLTDRNCVSACDDFSGAVKDLHLGRLVGTRTGGVVSGPARGYVLDDGSVLLLPPLHQVEAGHEIINGIGVAPDYYVPLTAYDLSTGHDPDVAKALALLGG